MANVVITGGSRGIGAEAVRLFSQRGDRVFFIYEKDHESAKKVCEDTGATALCCDVSSGEQVRNAFSCIPDIDILICNAGICHYGLISMIDEETWTRIFDVNVKGVYHCVNAALPYFLKKQSGAIVTVSSMWGQVGSSCEVAYSASKGAIIAMTKALAKELGPSGIRVNCVAPGVILTDMCKDVGADILEELRQETPVGRNGTPQDIAKAMMNLADSEFITGTVLSVNGGFVI